MQSSEIVQIMVTCISTAGALLCAVIERGRRKKESNSSNEVASVSEKRTEKKWTKSRIGLFACLFIAVVSIGFFLFWPKPIEEGKITYPMNQSLCRQTETIQGTSHNIANDKKIWVVVFPQEAGRYYPQNKPADVAVNGNWSSITYIGVPEDVGKRFDILAIGADKSVQDSISVYLAVARDKSDAAGLEQLPDGAVLYDRISVIRE